MWIAIKNPEILSSQLSKMAFLMSQARMSFFKKGVMFSGMNPEQTILVMLEIPKDALSGYKWRISPDFLINIKELNNAIKQLKKPITFDFYEDFISLMDDDKTLRIPCFAINDTWQEPSLIFRAKHDFQLVTTLFKSPEIQSHCSYPILLTEEGKDCSTRCIISPKELKL